MSREAASYGRRMETHADDYSTERLLSAKARENAELRELLAAVAGVQSPADRLLGGR